MIMETLGKFTSTDGRKTTEMLEEEFTPLDMHQEGYDVLKEYLSSDELAEEDRWFDIEESNEG